MSCTITSIGPRRNGTSARLVSLDDEPWRDVPIDVIRQIGLREGDLVDADDLSDSILSAEPDAARIRVLRLIEHRDRSCHEIRDRLGSDGYGEDAVADLVVRFQSAGLIDDSALSLRLATSMVESRHYGPIRVRSELRRKGFDPQLIEQAIEANLEGPAIQSHAEIAARRFAATARDPQRLTERLVRLGYDWEIARRTAALAWEDTHSSPA